MIGRVSERLIYDNYDVKIKKYNDDRIEIYIYDNSISYKKPGFEEVVSNEDFLSFDTRASKKRASEGVHRKDNLNRSFGTLMDLAYCNNSEWRSFITLTFAENVKDLDFANNEFKKWIKKIRYRFKDFKYLGVPEFQKRGAVHYHLLTNILPGSDFAPLQEPNSSKYDVLYWEHGFSSVFDLKLADNKFDIGKYMAKYFYKDIDQRLFGRRKILYSRNLQRPMVKKMKSSESDFNEMVIQLMTNYEHKRKRVITKSDYATDFIIFTFTK